MQLALSGALRYKYADPFIASVSFIWWIGFYTAPDSRIRIPGPDPDPDPDRQFAWYGWLGE
jgi:hypothetical protein